MAILIVAVFPSRLTRYKRLPSNFNIDRDIPLFGLAVMFFSVIPARAFHTAPQCAGSFGYGSDGKPHCDVGKFNAAKKAGKKYKYDPATAGNLKNQKNR